jgi:hypothetical protein
MDNDLQKYVAAIALEWATQHCEQVETPVPSAQWIENFAKRWIEDNEEDLIESITQSVNNALCEER